MDYYNFSSKITEPLDLLQTSPVRRGFRSAHREWAPGPAGQGINAHWRHCPRNLAKPTAPVFEKGAPSTSLHLKNSSERETYEQYSILSYTNLQYSSYHNRSAPNQVPKERPVIRVSVIPNNNESNKPRKRRSQIKKIQSTLSNQESSIKTKNVYFVVKGRKKEKVYQIKTTGSVELQSNQRSKVENVAIDENLKELIKSLNMDKKKKKAKKKVMESEDDEYEIYERGSPTSINEILQDPSSNRHQQDIFLPGCHCPQPERKRTSNDSKDLKSRVKIFGRIGLGEDAQYILNCNATVDDKPIETNIQGNINGPPLERENRMLRQEHQPRKRGQRDFIVQADMGNNVGPISVEFSTSVATQCSPANFNSVCFSNIEKLQIMTNTNQTLNWTTPAQTLNYKCNTKQNNNANISDYESGSQTPHSCSSPLVIISVYPKQGTAENVPDHNTDQNNSTKEAKSNSPPQKPNSGIGSLVKRFSNAKQNADNEKQQDKRESRSPDSSGTPRSPRTRSPSPTPGSTSPGRNSPKPKKEAKQDPKGPKQKPNKISPVTPRSSANLNKKQPQKDKTTKVTIPKSPKISPNVSRPGQSKQPTKVNEKQHKKELSDPIITKKAIVDAYTKKVTAQMRHGNAGKEAQGISSNVAVNIEGESEYYDVIFHQGARTTDLRVRKIMKNQASQKSYADVDEERSASLENFFCLSDINSRRSFSIDFNRPNDGEFEQDSSRMKSFVRDSIEICHRREINSGSKLNVLNSFENSFTDPERKNEFHAPIKHFKGDDCPLPNPVERDKEIRQLLGVDNRRPSFTRQADAGNKWFNIQNSSKSVRCFFRPRETKRISKIQESVKCIRVNCECDRDCCSPPTSSTSEETQTEQSEDLINSTEHQCTLCPEPYHGIDNRLCPELCPNYDNRLYPGPRPDLNNKLSLASHPDIDNRFSRGPRHDESSTSKDKEAQYELKAPVYQQLILNRNVNVFLQIEQFTKEKPIVLTRAQYEKVKKTIEKANLKRPGHKIFKKVSSGNVAQMQSNVLKKTQEKTDLKKTSIESERTFRRKSKHHTDSSESREAIDWKSNDSDGKSREGFDRKSKNYEEKSRKAIDRKSKDRGKDKSEGLPFDSHIINKPQKPVQPIKKRCKNCGAIQTARYCPDCGRMHLTHCELCGKQTGFKNPHCCTLLSCSSQPPSCASWPSTHASWQSSCASRPPPCASQRRLCVSRCNYCGVHYDRLYKKDKQEKATSCSNIQKTNVLDLKPHAVPSTEVHYTNISYMKHVTFSSTKIKEITMQEQRPSPAQAMLPEKDSPSIHTLFKGHRRSPTPNLGTSEFSLYSDAQSSKEPEPEKPRKPFLKRLMSCLVLHSKPSQIRVPENPKHRLRSVNSSIDSYHISTSLAPADLSSSIYDTSVSFYSNHSVYPINSKQTMKRGFLSSVRGLLYRAA